MLAARVLAPGTIVAGTAPEPSPGRGQVLVRTALASLCGSDLHVVDDPALRGPLPWGHPGHEAVGIVAESRARGLRPGCRVLCIPPAVDAAAFAELQVLDGRYVVPLPDADAPLAELLMAQQLGTVLFAARSSGVDAFGRSVAVLGLGSAGMFWGEWLRRSGARRIVGIDPSPQRRAAATAFGIDAVIDPGEGDVAARTAEVLGASGADIVVEAVGHPETTALSVDLAAVDGDLIWFGLPSGSGRIALSYATFFRKRLTTRSMYGAQDEPGSVSFRLALDLIARRAVDVRPMLSHTVPLSSIAAAFELAREPSGSGALKITVVPE